MPVGYSTVWPRRNLMRRQGKSRPDGVDGLYIGVTEEIITLIRGDFVEGGWRAVSRNEQAAAGPVL